MHLRVKLFRWRLGEGSPSHIALSKVVGAVGGVPGIVTACPGQGAREGGVEIVQGPGDDGVVVEGDVQGDDANSKANACVERKAKSLEELSMGSLAAGQFVHISAIPRQSWDHGA